jgi:hypothetical protein
VPPFSPENSPTPLLARAVRALFAQEAGSATTSAEVAAGAGRCLNRLELHLARIVGEAGIQALVARTFLLTRSVYPWVPLTSDAPAGAAGNDLRSLLEAQPLETAHEASIHAIATLVGLVARFIGEGLTLRLLEELWPPPSDPDPSKETT